MGKKVTGSVGFYKGYPVEIKTTRCFVYSKDLKKNIRGVEVWPLVEWDRDFLKESFLNFGKALKPPYDVTSPYTTFVFIDIVDFRKNFVYSEAAQVLYGKEILSTRVS